MCRAGRTSTAFRAGLLCFLPVAHGSPEPREVSEREGGGGGWHPKVCVPKMATAHFVFFPHDGPFGLGAGVGGSRRGVPPSSCGG